MIHSGVAEPFFNPDAAAVEQVRERYRLQRPFVLFVGTIEPRKNLDLLMSAYRDLPASTRQEFELVIAGPSGWARAETLARLREVRYLGYVPEPDLAPLTAAAAVFAISPRCTRGSVFPVAQAMAAGVPVVTSNVSSLPEIAGGAAVRGSTQPEGIARRAGRAAGFCGAARGTGGAGACERRSFAGKLVPRARWNSLLGSRGGRRDDDEDSGRIDDGRKDESAGSFAERCSSRKNSGRCTRTGAFTAP